MDLQNKIYTCRKNAGLSQEALAERIGVSRQAISKWETGEATPEVAKLLSLAKTFGVTTDWMLSDEPDLPANEPETEPIIEEEPPVDDTTAGQSEETPEPIAEELPPPEQEPVKEDNVTPEPEEEQTFTRKLYDTFGRFTGIYVIIFAILAFIYAILFRIFAFRYFNGFYEAILVLYSLAVIFGSVVLFIYGICVLAKMHRIYERTSINTRLETHQAKVLRREERLNNIVKRFGWMWSLFLPILGSLIASLGLVMWSDPTLFEIFVALLGFFMVVISVIGILISPIFIYRLYRRWKNVNRK